MEFTVSILIPVYNAELFIEKAVKSALDQPETREIILVEDGSSDDSLKICSEISARNNRIKLFRHPNGENRGAGASRNLAISKASCDYIAFLDSDDYYLPDRFVKTKSIFWEYPETDGVYECLGTYYFTSKARILYEKTRRTTLTTITKSDIAPQNLFTELVLNKYGYFSLDALTIKKSALGGVLQFDETLRIAQDTDFILSLANKIILRPGNIEQPVSMRGVHGKNRTLDAKNVLQSKQQFYKKWYYKINQNQWSKPVNRQFLLLYSVTSARMVTTGIWQWPLAIINVFRNLLSTSWILRKIL